MRPMLKLMALLVCLTLTGFSQIDNVQFKDTDGREYDLYEVLASGKYVLCHFMNST